MSFKEFLQGYGWGLAVIAVIVIGIVIAVTINLPNNSDNPIEFDPVVEPIVDTNFSVETVGKFSCPSGYNYTLHEFCDKLSPAYYPANQDLNFILDFYVAQGANCQMGESGSIWCQDCLNSRKYGWTCIDANSGLAITFQRSGVN